ncbi:hypothetical protein VNI00_005330 [Paramarasmius palmivorus]|uniref:Uncharacterized protein n=1 Tax=Paramarasmius palmivorus TaxID=297713 RepID=A0AAW0DF58_9AGAR
MPLDQIDPDEDDSQRDSGEVFQPVVKRTSGNGKGKGKKPSSPRKSLGGEAASPESVQLGMGDELSPLTDTEDELPSPTTVLARRIVSESGVGRGVSPSISIKNKEAAGPPHKSRVEDEPASPRSTKKRGATNVHSGGKIEKGKSVGQAVVNVPSSQSGDIDLDNGSAHSPSRIKDRSRVKADIGTAKTANTDNRGRGKTRLPGVASVFSNAVALPEEEDYDDSDLDSDAGAADPKDPLLDVKRIHPELVGLYETLPWIDKLRRSKFVGYPNVNSDTAFDDFTPISYGGLLETINPRVRSKLVRSVSFIEYKDIRNPVRVPLAAFARNWECLRLPRGEGNRNAAFVLTGVCSQSFVAQGREVGQSYVKQLHIRPLENDWIIFQSNVGTYFNDDLLHAPGRRSALVFQTKRDGWIPRQNEGDKLASAPYSKDQEEADADGGEAGSSQKVDLVDVSNVNIVRHGVPAYRTFDEGIPLYDGRTKLGTQGFRFGPVDWEDYTNLPIYPRPEVDTGSLATVVFTLTGFRGSTNIHHTVHFNALFAIVLGKVDG